MSRTLLALLTLLATAGSACAQADLAKAPRRAAVVQATSGPAAEASRPAPTEAREADLTGRTVFQVLLGELALQRGNLDIAVGSYADLARRTQDPRVIERAAEIAGFARQFELAQELAQLWLQVEPESAKARQTLATLMVLLGRIDDLAPQIGALLEQDKANLPDNLMRLNRMLARHADRQAVQRLVNKVAAPYQGLAEAHYAMALAASNAGDQPRAVAEAAEALKARPDWEMAALLRAQLQAKQSTPEAIDGLTRFVGRYPMSADARLALARLLITEKRYDEARPHFDRLLKDYPDRPEIIYPVAMLALQQNDLTTGKEQLEKLLTGDFPDKSTVHFFLGQIEEERKNSEAALTHYREVGAGDQLIPARARAAQLLLQQGRFDEARKAIHGTPGRTDAEKTQLALAEAQLLREAKRHQEAYGVLEAALRKQPENTDLLYEAALIAERLGRFETLESHLKRLLDINPEHAHGLNALGYSLADRNVRLDEAHRFIAKAVALAPEDPFIMDSLGWVLYRQGKLEEALKVLSQAYARKPDPEIAAHLGEVLWALNRKDDARKLLSEAASKNPDNDALSAAVRRFLP